MRILSAFAALLLLLSSTVAATLGVGGRAEAQTINSVPTGPRGGGGGRGAAIGIGIGIIAPIIINELAKKPKQPPADNPPPQRTTNPPAGNAPPRTPTYVSLPDPAPLPPVLPVATALSDDSYRPGEVIVLLGPGSGPDTAAQIAAEYNLAVLRETPIALTGQRIVLFAIPNDRPVPEVQTVLLADPRAQEVQKNFIYLLSGEAAAGSMAGGQYALDALRVARAHQQARGRGVTIAVIDSQIALDHPEIAGAVAISFDAAGFGIDEADRHGTSVAGIIAARGGLVGIAPEARILAVRAFWKETKDGPLASSSEAIARGIDWAVAQGAQVLNLSFVGPKDRLAANLIEAARQRGIVAVAAAGNNGPDAPPAYPGALDSVIAVTATDARNALFASANRGDYVDVAAPGVEILSPSPDGGYQTISGTSMATAHISGVLALLMETAAGSRIGFEEVRAAIAESARDLGAPGRDPEFGAGLANAEALLAARTRKNAARAQQ